MNLTAGMETYKPQMQNSGQGGLIVKAAPRVSCVALSPGTPGQCGQVMVHTATGQTRLPRQGPGRFCTAHGSQQVGVAGLRTPYHSPHNVALKKQLTIHQELPLH